MLLLELTPERLLKLKEAGAPAVELEGRARGIGEHGHTLRVAHPDPKGREHGGRPRDDHVTAAELARAACVHSGRATVGEDREACGVEATLDGDAPIRSAI